MGHEDKKRIYTHWEAVSMLCECPGDSQERELPHAVTNFLILDLFTDANMILIVFQANRSRKRGGSAKGAKGPLAP